MTDSSVAITAGSGTPIRVLTGLGAATADQQVVTLADSSGNLLGGTGGPVYVQPQNVIVSASYSANTVVDGTTDVSNYTSVKIHISGSTNAANLEYSPDGTTWTAFQAVGVVSGDWANQLSTGAYLAPVPAKFVRLNVVSVSGASVIRLVYTQATPPQRAIQLGTGTQAIGSVSSVGSVGTVAAGTNLIGAVNIGATVGIGAYAQTTTASTNAANVKSSSGFVYELTLTNPTATVAYVKLFNKASAPTVGTDLPIAIFPVAANSVAVYQFGANGKKFTTGIAVATTGAIGATDTTAAVAAVLIHATYS